MSTSSDSIQFEDHEEMNDNDQPRPPALNCCSSHTDTSISIAEDSPLIVQTTTAPLAAEEQQAERNSSLSIAEDNPSLQGEEASAGAAVENAVPTVAEEATPQAPLHNPPSWLVPSMSESTEALDLLSRTESRRPIGDTDMSNTLHNENDVTPPPPPRNPDEDESETAIRDVVAKAGSESSISIAEDSREQADATTAPAAEAEQTKSDADALVDEDDVPTVAEEATPHAPLHNPPSWLVPSMSESTEALDLLSRTESRRPIGDTDMSNTLHNENDVTAPPPPRNPDEDESEACGAVAKTGSESSISIAEDSPLIVQTTTAPLAAEEQQAERNSSLSIAEENPSLQGEEASAGAAVENAVPTVVEEATPQAPLHNPPSWLVPSMSESTEALDMMSLAESPAGNVVDTDMSNTLHNENDVTPPPPPRNPDEDESETAIRDVVAKAGSESSISIAEDSREQADATTAPAAEAEQTKSDADALVDEDDVPTVAEEATPHAPLHNPPSWLVPSMSESTEALDLLSRTESRRPIGDTDMSNTLHNENDVTPPPPPRNPDEDESETAIRDVVAKAGSESSISIAEDSREQADATTAPAAEAEQTKSDADALVDEDDVPTVAEEATPHAPLHNPPSWLVPSMSESTEALDLLSRTESRRPIGDTDMSNTLHNENDVTAPPPPRNPDEDESEACGAVAKTGSESSISIAEDSPLIVQTTTAPLAAEEQQAERNSSLSIAEENPSLQGEEASAGAAVENAVPTVVEEATPQAPLHNPPSWLVPSMSESTEALDMMSLAESPAGNVVDTDMSNTLHNENDVTPPPPPRNPDEDESETAIRDVVAKAGSESSISIAEDSREQADATTAPAAEAEQTKSDADALVDEDDVPTVAEEATPHAPLHNPPSWLVPSMSESTEALDLLSRTESRRPIGDTDMSNTLHNENDVTPPPPPRNPDEDESEACGAVAKAGSESSISIAEDSPLIVQTTTAPLAAEEQQAERNSSLSIAEENPSLQGEEASAGAAVENAVPTVVEEATPQAPLHNPPSWLVPSMSESTEALDMMSLAESPAGNVVDTDMSNTLHNENDVTPPPPPRNPYEDESDSVVVVDEVGLTRPSAGTRSSMRVHVMTPEKPVVVEEARRPPNSTEKDNCRERRAECSPLPIRRTPLDAARDLEYGRPVTKSASPPSCFGWREKLEQSYEDRIAQLEEELRAVRSRREELEKDKLLLARQYACESSPCRSSAASSAGRSLQKKGCDFIVVPKLYEGTPLGRRNDQRSSTGSSGSLPVSCRHGRRPPPGSSSLSSFQRPMADSRGNAAGSRSGSGNLCSPPPTLRHSNNAGLSSSAQRDGCRARSSSDGMTRNASRQNGSAAHCETTGRPPSTGVDSACLMGSFLLSDARKAYSFAKEERFKPILRDGPDLFFDCSSAVGRQTCRNPYVSPGPGSYTPRFGKVAHSTWF